MRSGTRSILFTVCLLPVFAATVWATTNTIQVFNFGFGPTNATINVGDTVQWVWASGITSHSTTAATNQLENWDTGLHAQPFTFSRTFNNVGTFGYYCSSHGFEAHCGNGSGMSGHIIVVSPGATAHRRSPRRGRGGGKGARAARPTAPPRPPPPPAPFVACGKQGPDSGGAGPAPAPPPPPPPPPPALPRLR